MICVIYEFVYVITKFMLGLLCCFRHHVFCRSVCLMWQCVTPSNFQTSTSWSRRYLADTPYSPISTLLSPPSDIIIFHFLLNSPWPDCRCTIIIIITFELTGFLCFRSHTNSYNTTSYIQIRTTSLTSLKTNSYIRTGLTTSYQVRHTNLYYTSTSFYQFVYTN